MGAGEWTAGRGGPESAKAKLANRAEIGTKGQKRGRNEVDRAAMGSDVMDSDVIRGDVIGSASGGRGRREGWAGRGRVRREAATERFGLGLPGQGLAQSPVRGGVGWGCSRGWGQAQAWGPGHSPRHGR